MSGWQGTATRSNPMEGLAAFVEAHYRDHPWVFKGKVQSFDAGKQTGSFQPQMTRVFGDKTLTAPLVQDIRVRFQRGGGHIAFFPLKTGNDVTLITQPRSYDTQETEGGNASHNPTRVASLSDVFALPGGGDDTNVVKNMPTNAAHFGNEDGKKGLQSRENGDVSIVGGDSGKDKFLARKDEKIDIRGGANNESVLKVMTDMLNIAKAAATGDVQAQYTALLATMNRIMAPQS